MTSLTGTALLGPASVPKFLPLVDLIGCQVTKIGVGMQVFAIAKLVGGLGWPKLPHRNKVLVILRR